MSSEFPLAEYVVNGSPLRFFPPFCLGNIPLPVDILDILISKYLPGFAPGWADYDREEITPVRILYHISQNQLGNIGTIEIYKTGDIQSEMSVKLPSYTIYKNEKALIEKHGKKDLKKLKKSHQKKVINTLFSSLSHDDTWNSHWRTALENLKGDSADNDVRISIDDIDSFIKIRNVTADEIEDLMQKGRLEIKEDFIQTSLEAILRIPFHKKDWGGEENDLYTSNLILNDKKISTAFLLKGSGLKKKKLEIRDCGINGDQIIRLVQSPAELFIIQFIGEISESVIKDIDGKVRLMKYQNKPGRYCIIDGQDTARLIRAYGKL